MVSKVKTTFLSQVFYQFSSRHVSFHFQAYALSYFWVSLWRRPYHQRHRCRLYSTLITKIESRFFGKDLGSWSYFFVLRSFLLLMVFFFPNRNTSRIFWRKHRWPMLNGYVTNVSQSRNNIMMAPFTNAICYQSIKVPCDRENIAKILVYRVPKQILLGSHTNTNMDIT